MSINLVSATWTSGLDELLNPWAKAVSPEPFLPLWLDQVYNGFLLSAFLYAAILSVSYLVESRERLARQQIETARLSELVRVHVFSASADDTVHGHSQLRFRIQRKRWEERCSSTGSPP